MHSGDQTESKQPTLFSAPSTATPAGAISSIVLIDSVELIKSSLKRLHRRVDYAFDSYSFIGHSYEEKSVKPASYEQFREAMKQLLTELQKRMAHLEEILPKCEGPLANQLLIEVLKGGLKECQEANEKLIAALKVQESKLEPKLPESQHLHFNLLLDDIQACFRMMPSLSKEEIESHLERELFKTTLSDLPKTCYPKGRAPSCFISYSWGISGQVCQVHRIARDLKRAGIDVKLDIWHNTTGSIPAYLSLINEVDYVIVVGTPDLVEKWKNFTSSGQSRGKEDKDYQGNVVTQEIEIIWGRKKARPNKNHGIINLLLSGAHDSSFPSILNLPSSDTDFSKQQFYDHAFFNLLARLLPKPDSSSEIKAQEEAHKAQIIQTEKTFVVECQGLKSLDEAKQRETYLDLKGPKKTKEEMGHQALMKLNTKTSSLKERKMLADSKNSSEHKEKDDLSPRSKLIGDSVLSVKFWNLPFANSYFAGRTKTLHDINAMFKQESTSSLIVTLCGQQGIGKTEIATSYVHSKYISHYVYRVWFNASDQVQLVEEYKRFGLDFNMIQGNENSATVVKKVRDWFETKSRWLIIYDGAESFQKLKDFIPQEGGHILITSHKRGWPSPEIVIQEMELEDCIEFVKKVIKNDAPLDDIKLLVKTFDGFPLAIAQAAFYIQSRARSVMGYLAEYKEEQEKIPLLSTPAILGVNHRPLVITWNLTIQAIKEESTHAFNLINCLAYLYPRNVPRRFLLNFLNEFDSKIKKRDVDDCIACLLSYSVITADENVLNIHPLLQIVIGASHKYPNEWLDKVLSVITIDDPTCELVLGGIASYEKNLAMIMSYYQKILSNTPKPDIYQCLGCCYLVINNFERAEACFKAGIENGGGLSIHCEYGNALYLQKRFEEAIVQMEKVIEKSPGSNRFSYFSELEKMSVDSTMQDEIDRLGVIRIKPINLAYYVLCRCYQALKHERFYYYLEKLTEVAERENDPFLKKVIATQFVAAVRNTVVQGTAHGSGQSNPVDAEFSRSAETQSVTKLLVAQREREGLHVDPPIAGIPSAVFSALAKDQKIEKESGKDSPKVEAILGGIKRTREENDDAESSSAPSKKKQKDRHHSTTDAQPMDEIDARERVSPRWYNIFCINDWFRNIS